MNPIEANHFVNSLLYLFKETFEGSPETGSIYLDRGIGVFNTIADLDAETASIQVSGSTIAAHTEHLRYYLEVLNNFLLGIVQVADWKAAWSHLTVSDAEWEKIIENLRKTFDLVVKSFNEIVEWDEDRISEAMAIVVHTAYHLGAIRQIMKAVSLKVNSNGSL